MNIAAHNLLAMNAQRQFGINSKSKAKTTEKLASGYRINRSSDDAAGLAISEKMRRQIRGLTQGVQNTQDGVSLCQVADGALNEVSDIINRLEELSVKAANGTNSQEDRSYIQKEVENLLQEVDRISDTTTFNELPLFKGSDQVVTNTDGTPAIEGAIPFTDFQLADLSLGTSPFSANSSGSQLSLQAVVNNQNLASYGKSYNLIYGSGGTSYPSIRLNYLDSNGQNQTNTYEFAGLPSSNFQSGLDGNGNAYWSRDFVIQNSDGVDMKVTQKISIGADTSTDKNYSLEYQIENLSTDKNVDVDFMFHVDTAYNNNDRCEGYYIDGNRVQNSCIYSKDGSKFTDGSTNANVISGIPSSLSIVDVDEALAFSEKITFDNSSKPDSFSIGNYSSIHDWSYYDNLDGNLGRNAIRDDLGFSLLWNYDMNAGDTKNVKFSYGIAATAQDNNLQNVTVNNSTQAVTNHYADNPIWIQSGVEPEDGINVVIGEMNTSVLGLRGMDVSTPQGANTAMLQTKNAQKNLMANRSNIGAQQNRLEHTIANENNIVENTTAAESRIRDADMAKEMVKLSMQNVIEQAGISIMSQANQSNQGVLNLLS